MNSNQFLYLPDTSGLCGFVRGALRVSFGHEVTLARLLQEALVTWPPREPGHDVAEYARQMTLALQQAVKLLQEEAKTVDVLGDLSTPSQTTVRLK